MEVLGNGSPIKESENQTSGGNYTCRLTRDLTIGNGAVARSKVETDVRLLVACKAQLSSEVIRLKTDSLRLQKERDSARIRMRELDQVVGKFKERTRELENRLLVAEDENKRLRERMSPNTSALPKPPMPVDDYHSYPWPENQASSSVTSCLTLEMRDPPQEDWKKVSQQLLEKMKQEMKELQELNNSFSFQGSEKGLATNEGVVPQTNNLKFCEDNVEESLFGLIADTETLKHTLLQQRKTLSSLLNDITLGNPQLNRKEPTKEESKGFKTGQVSGDLPASKAKTSVSQYSKLSDDNFRAFFTKHLEGCRNIDETIKATQLSTQIDSQAAVSNSCKSTLKVISPKSAKSKTTETDRQNSDKKTAEDERVCPICQVSFNKSVPQNEFEEHVVDHLEVESASLLDQYVVL